MPECQAVRNRRALLRDRLLQLDDGARALQSMRERGATPLRLEMLAE